MSLPEPRFAERDNRDLITSLTIDNIMQSEVGKVLEAIREAGYEIEINVTRPVR